MRRALLAAALVVAALVVAPGADARRPAGRAATAKKARTAAPAIKRERAGERSDGGKPAGGNKPAPAASTATAETDAPGGGEAGGAAAATTTTGGGKTLKTKTYTFGALDVEGKLKTPQLLYFLDRVKLELDMSAPDKRSFMKELEKSADDNNL